MHSEAGDGAVTGTAKPVTAEPGTKSGNSGARNSQASRRRRWRRRAGVAGAQILIVAVAMLLWEELARAGVISDLFFSRPSQIFPALWQGLFVNGSLRTALGNSLYVTFAGFLIASVAAFLLGLVLYQFPILEQISRPFVNAANNMPRLALTPIFILWLGIGNASHIALVVTLVFFTVLLNTMAGLRTASRDQLLLARALGASRRKLYIRFLLPSAVPSIFVGLQLGLTFAFMGAVIGEIISGGQGLGAAISVDSATYRTADVFANLLLIAAVAAFLAWLLKWLETRLLRWHAYELRAAR